MKCTSDIPEWDHPKESETRKKKWMADEIIEIIKKAANNAKKWYKT